MVSKTEKLLKKIKKKDRQRLLEIVSKLRNNEIQGLNIQKIKKSDFYRLRTRRFRIIFHYQKNKTFIDSIKLRNEKTYKRL